MDHPNGGHGLFDRDGGALAPFSTVVRASKLRIGSSSACEAPTNVRTALLVLSLALGAAVLGCGGADPPAPTPSAWTAASAPTASVASSIVASSAPVTPTTT